MRLITAVFCCWWLACAPAQAQNLHPISDAEIRAMAYAGCTEAGVEPYRGEQAVQYSVYNRGLKDRRDLGGWRLTRVVAMPGQYNGVEWHRRCSAAQWRRSMRIANEIVDGLYMPDRGWVDITNFLSPCHSSSGGIAGFRGLVYVGTIGGHDFYRERRPGERAHFLSCAESPTRSWRGVPHKRPRQRAPQYVAQQ